MMNLGLAPDATHLTDRGMKVGDMVATLRKHGVELTLVKFEGTGREFAKAHPEGKFLVVAAGHVMVSSNGFLLNQVGCGNYPVVIAMKAEVK
jgi:hypothetical protein